MSALDAVLLIIGVVFLIFGVLDLLSGSLVAGVVLVLLGLGALALRSGRLIR